MKLIAAHGVFISNKCPTVSHCSHLSIAEYIFDHSEEKVNSFQHKHDEYEFMIPVKTISLLHYDKASYIGEVGFIYPVNPNVSHGLEFDMENGHFYSVVISRFYVEQIKKALGLENHYFYARFLINRYLINQLKLFQVLTREHDPKKEELEEVARKITEYFVEEGLSSSKDLRRPEKQHATIIKNMILYMHEHFHEADLTINKIASLSGYSLTHFTKAFKLYMGHTPIAHLNKLRLSEAKFLLRGSKHSFKEIAIRCGFKNTSTFTESFKRNVGMLPKDYRKRLS
ncbi:MAG: HTH-type transcriptional activator RhaS [Tenericutes bacterium ADurb.Bin239]|jgi:AraC-like DNA-binding protein|nr:MAG: HTH-type transcriptional activator RhaS [Tenericutes bacterium ADurb.Bin239]